MMGINKAMHKRLRVAVRLLWAQRALMSTLLSSLLCKETRFCLYGKTVGGLHIISWASWPCANDLKTGHAQSPCSLATAHSAGRRVIRLAKGTEMQLDSLKTTGPAVAALLHSLTTSQDDFDGLILGTLLADISALLRP